MPEIRNPNIQTPGSGGGSGGSGGDMRGTMIFAMLMLVVLLGYQYFFKPATPTAPAASQTQAQQTQVPAQAASVQQAQSAVPSVQTPTSTPAVAAAMETATTIENEQCKIVFTNRGAQVTHWILKKYNDSAGKPLDMVQPQTAARFGLPLSFFTYEPALTTQLNQALYQVTATGAQPSATGNAIAPETSALTFHCRRRPRRCEDHPL